MRCPTCKRPMTALFTSYACDWCDGIRRVEAGHHGFALVPQPVPLAGTEAYVFPTAQMAEHYRDHALVAYAPVREVVSQTAFHWAKGRGSIDNLELADRLYTIYPDHKYEPGPHRAHVEVTRPAR